MPQGPNLAYLHFQSPLICTVFCPALLTSYINKQTDKYKIKTRICFVKMLIIMNENTYLTLTLLNN